MYRLGPDGKCSGRGTKTGTVVYICEICEAEVERPYEGPCLTERPL